MGGKSHRTEGTDRPAEPDVPLALAPDPAGIRRAAEIIDAGGLVAFPTESSFGLAARFDRAGALERLAEVKGRAAHMPFPLIVTDRQEKDNLAGGLTGAAADLARDHWPGPLTIVFRPRGKTPLHSLLSSRLGIGIRRSAHPVASALVAAVGRPITATSANRTGRPAAMTADQVRETFGSDVDAVVEAEPWRQAPSTVAVAWAWGVEVLREGPIDIPVEQRVTRDEILRGRLELLQPARGYRFSVDSLILAHFGSMVLIPSGTSTLVVDLGAGCGVVGLAMIRQDGHEHWVRPVGTDLRIWAVEIQPRLAALARLNGPLNGLSEDLYQVIEGDLRKPGDLSAVPAGQADLVLSNPPYQPVGRGRPSPNGERDRATRQISATIDDVVHAAARLLRPNGRFAVVLPAERLTDLVASCLVAGLAPTVLRPVHAYRDQSARRVLVAATRTNKQIDLRIEPPLVLHETPGQDTEELAAILGEGTGRLLPRWKGTTLRPQGARDDA